MSNDTAVNNQIEEHHLLEWAMGIMCNVSEDNQSEEWKEAFIKWNKQYHELKHDQIGASEALFGFCAWLTTRKEVIKLGSSEDAAPIVELLKAFTEENQLKDPRENYTGYYRNPVEVEA